jgi:hypothetical protein
MLILALRASSFHHFWRFAATEPGEGQDETFNASIRAYEYISSHAYPWQKVFYLVLVPVFVINLICLVYLVSVRGRVTDCTEPQNLCILALNSTPAIRWTVPAAQDPRRTSLALQGAWDMLRRKITTTYEGSGRRR